MSHLQPRHVEEIERILGAPLGPLLTRAETLDDLSRAAMDVVRSIAKESRQLALAYLPEVIPTARISFLITFLVPPLSGRWALAPGGRCARPRTRPRGAGSRRAREAPASFGRAHPS